jgi:hypothetical protein
MMETNQEVNPAVVEGLSESEPIVPQSQSRQQQAVETILAKLTNSYEANHYHPYLEDNDVGAFDLSIDDEGNLLGVGIDLKASFIGTAYIPRPRNLLTITPYGQVSLEPGARVYGAALMIGHNQFRRIAKAPNGFHEIFVALDYATGAFLYENTNQPVVIVFRPSNVKSAVEMGVTKKIHFFTHFGIIPLGANSSRLKGESKWMWPRQHSLLTLPKS